MNNKSASEKYNIIFIILLFVIPLISLNASFYYLSNNIDKEWVLKDQEKKALQEAETLSSEADFGLQLESHFSKFFEDLKINFKDVEDGLLNDSEYVNLIEISLDKVFAKPFPEYSIYVFKKTLKTSKTELLYYKGDIKSGKRGLCLGFEHLYNLNNDIKLDEVKRKNSEAFAKMLLGRYTNTVSIAKDLRGMSTFSNGIHNPSWFIWDYISINKNEVIGAYLLCNKISNHDSYARQLALKNLQQRGNAAGAFLPVYKDYGEACIPSPLDKSKTFQKWAETITIQDKNDLEKWFKESLPQRVPLGKYTAYCHLGRGATHMAVVLVKSIKGFVMPKWLISVDIFTLLILFLVIYLGIAFKKWPQISLTTRFALSYFLASVLPLSLICVSAYGYMLEYKNTIINKTISDLQSALKSFDHQKVESVKKYRAAFIKAINDENLAQLIKENGIKEDIVAQRVIDIFETTEKLPILGVKILDEAGEGAFLSGNASTSFKIEPFVESIIPSQVNILRDKLKEEFPDAKLKEYKGHEEESFDSATYKSFTGNDLVSSMSKHFSVPIPRKNGNFGTTYHIFDYIRIDGKVKYMLFVVWDDKTIDDEIIQNAFDNYTLSYLNESFIDKDNRKDLQIGFSSSMLKQNFIACRIKGQSLDDISKTRQASKELIKEAKGKAKIAITSKKTDSFTEKDNIIVAMPALNFNQTVFVGWESMNDIDKSIRIRILILVLLILFSLYILWLCSRRSAEVFLKPVSALKGALDEVSTGNLKVGFRNEPKDELGNLSNEFSKMIEGLRERERLSKIISDQAVKAIEKHSNGLLNDTETFKGVALVSDIRNFTGTSEKYEPTLITDLLNEHFAEMTKIISENGGLIYKFIGDAIEAVFPENTDFEEDALERAFKAGSMMIAKLVSINARREKVGLFPYKIGVGLCYGTMHSGTVGSLDTRLDYAILGDPLKNAAKYEALSIQNPEFPLVFGEDIAKKVEKYGFKCLNIDSKGQNFKVFSIDKIINTTSESLKLANNEQNNNRAEKNEKYTYNIFSLLVDNKEKKHLYDLRLNVFILFCIAIFILLGSNTVFNTKFEDLKTESQKECSRLSEHLKCDEVLKSAFESLCLDFYEDVTQALAANENNTKIKSSKEIIEKISADYEKSGKIIPYICCCLYKGETSEIDGICSRGFSPDTSNKIASLAYILKKDKYENRQEEKINIIKNLMGNLTTINQIKTSHYRRSAIATLEDKEMYVDTNIIFDKEHKNYKAYIFCGMPSEADNIYLPRYYTLLAGNNVLFALRNQNKWEFSDNFPIKEQEFIKNNFNNINLLNKKGYKFDSIKIENETWTYYLITRKLAEYYTPELQLYLYLTLIIITLYFVIGFCLKKVFELWGNTVAIKLRTDIIASAILPLLTFGFVSYLFVNEYYNVKKSETRMKLNKLMDEVEEREFYYQPLCQTFFRELSRSKNIQQYINVANNPESNNEEKKEALKKLRFFLLNNILETKFKDVYFDKLNPFFRIPEIFIIGKNDWIVGVSGTKTNINLDENQISDFAAIMSKAGKCICLKNNRNNNGKVDVNETKDEIITEKVVEGYGSMFGSSFAVRMINFLDNLTCISVTHSTAGFYIVPLPSPENPDYVVFAFAFFSDKFLPYMCSIKNDVVPYRLHIASGSVGEELYCFYSPHMDIGSEFFYDRNNYYYGYNNPNEDLKTLKEFCLTSSWINSSYLPVSKTVDLYGPHFLEARKGNFVSDNIYVSLGSEKPLIQETWNKLSDYVSLIIFSIIMIYLIAQSIIFDLLEPIKQLMYGARMAAKGDYKYRTGFSRNDELGALCNSFDKMMKGLEEKQLMNSMVSKSALKVTAKSSDSQSKKINAVLMYVMPTDFDKAMKTLIPSELFTKLREQIAIIADIVIQYGGDIDKIMGEKLLIAFHLGDKTAKETAINAAKAAHLIENNPNLHFKVAVGVNYGLVISGYLGVGQKRDFTIIGDSVNVTARIASFAEKLESNKCVVSEDVMSLIKNEIKTEEYGEVQFKGKALPAKVYRIV